MNGAVVGLDWWGVGPTEMASAVPDTQPAPLWDLQRRFDRHLIDSFAAPWISYRRLHRALSSRNYDWVIVASPHRLSGRACQFIRERTALLIGLIGDLPEGRRELSPESVELFDVLAIPDATWRESLPSAAQAVVTEPWGSTIHDQHLLASQPFEFERVALVGSAYPARVQLANSLAADHDVVTIGNWPSVPRARQVPALGRAATLSELRSSRSLVLNVHHPQFRRGLNPQFFDYAASAIPQVVIYASDLHTAHFPYVDHPPMPLSVALDPKQMLKVSEVSSAIVREQYLFAHTIERLTGH